jgi:membrane protease YdiL (CAAX protease family)
MRSLGTTISYTKLTRMRPIRSLLIFVVVVFGGGALLAPWLYWLVQSVAPASGLAHNPFHRYVNRALLILALLGIWPLLRSLGAKSWGDVGIINPRSEWSRLWAGFALGFGSLACVAAIVLIAHGRQFNDHLNAAQLSGKVAGAAATAIIVAVLEELLFRGAIFGALRKVWNWRVALLLSSMIYAIVHFMQSADLPGAVTWSSGLQLLPQMLRGFGDLQVVIPCFFNLTLAGILLALAYQRTGNLYFSIGLHAGWIFWLKSYGFLTSPIGTTNEWLWGTQKLIDGWLALVVLTLALLVLLRLPQAKPGKTSV